MSTRPNSEHLSQLAKGVDSWNPRGKTPPKRYWLDYVGVKLNGQALQGIDFETETAFSSAIHKTISQLQAHLGERD
jgi:hypothetical protein